ncbi:MAG: energy transducer TonB [Lysobacteraceae bacterium]
MRYLLSLVLALLFSHHAAAGWRDDARASIEQSMLLTGTISVDTEGRVIDFSLDKSDRIPEAVRSFVGDRVVGWEFEPMKVDGKPAIAKNRMTMRVIAKHLDEERVEVRLSGVTFQPLEKNSKTQVRMPRRPLPPSYPSSARRAGVQGTVYLNARIARDGRVADTNVSQVDLRILDRPERSKRWREMLGDKVTRAVKSWKFQPPTEGGLADDEYWDVVVPVSFGLVGNEVRYGQWQFYVPGPYSPAPWKVTDVGSDSASVNALVGGGIYTEAGEGQLKLRSNLGS